MAALVALQAVAIALLVVLVAGLLRSHAEVLRTLHRLGADIGDPSAPPPGPQLIDLGRRRAGTGSGASSGAGWIEPVATATATTAVDLVGTTPWGEPFAMPLAGGGDEGRDPRRDTRRDTLVAFLSTGCFTCGEFWKAFADPDGLDLPKGTALAVVTKGEADEDTARLRQLAPAGVPVVMSSDVWRAFGVPVTPYFVHVDGETGVIVGQGSGSSWSQVVSLLHQATGDAAHAANGSSGARGRVAESEADIDRRLLALGITPGDARLYPNGPEPDGGRE